MTDHTLADFGSDGHLLTESPSDCSGECASILYALIRNVGFSRSVDSTARPPRDPECAACRSQNRGWPCEKHFHTGVNIALTGVHRPPCRFPDEGCPCMISLFEHRELLAAARADERERFERLCAGWESWTPSPWDEPAAELRAALAQPDENPSAPRHPPNNPTP